ncbi:MAG TPA: hypothetical protein VK859_16500 [bacterium]|jgi:hypothetical protein|nr:hypothetical protein [bacterium]
MRSFQSQSLRASTVKSKGPTGSMKSVFLYLVFPALWGLAGTAMALENNFHLAVMDYFRVSEQQVTDAEQSGISDEELPVVFFMAQRTNLGPEAVTTVHSSGLNWMQVAFHFRLNPWIFYTFLPGDAAAHTPFEKACGEYKNPNNNINLTDKDMVNLVDLKFLSEYYGRDPKEIVQRRSSGKTFQEINDDYWRRKDENSLQWDMDPLSSGLPTPTPSFHRQHKSSLNGFTAPE